MYIIVPPAAYVYLHALAIESPRDKCARANVEWTWQPTSYTSVHLSRGLSIASTCKYAAGGTTCAFMLSSNQMAKFLLGYVLVSSQRSCAVSTTHERRQVSFITIMCQIIHHVQRQWISLMTKSMVSLNKWLVEKEKRCCKTQDVQVTTPYDGYLFVTGLSTHLLTPCTCSRTFQSGQ